MGGGGGGRDLGDTSDLEQRAKEILKQGQTGRKNVFISFAQEDENEVNLLRGQAKNQNSDLEFNDFSVKEPYDSQRREYIQQRIRERIRQCSMTVVYLSSNTPQSRWVEWEAEESIRLGKRVIATHSGTAPPADLPDFIRRHGIRIVPWADLAAEVARN